MACDAHAGAPGAAARRPSCWASRPAARLGPLLAAFTGEHVGEPRLLICLYGPPRVHVDLKFVALDALAERIEDPVLLWDRSGDVRRRLDATPARYPQPDLQWIEDRFWIWVHCAATKLARRELFEALNMIACPRDRVLGPLALLEAAIACYRELRATLAPPGLGRSAAEHPAVAFLGEAARTIEEGPTPRGCVAVLAQARSVRYVGRSIHVTANRGGIMRGTNLIWFLVIGLAAGWLGSKVMRGKGYGLIGDLVIGVVGAFLGGWIFGLLHISAGGLLGLLVTAFVGAIVLIWLLRLAKRT